MSRGIEYTFMMEINNTRRHAHRLGAEQQVEEHIALKGNLFVSEPLDPIKSTSMEE
jgi:hypothetical protein